MITSLIDTLNSYIEQARAGRLSWVKSVRYGVAQAIPTTEMPAILYNVTSSRVVGFAAGQTTLEVKFGFFACSAVTATNEEATKVAQSLMWAYNTETPTDRGLLPWLIELQTQKIRDAKGRTWRATIDTEPKILVDRVGANVRGAVLFELKLTTLLHSLD